MKIEWVDGFEIGVELKDGAAVLSANREGMLSLARLLITLADETPGSHAHLDEYNSLNDGSAELIIVRTE